MVKSFSKFHPALHPTQAYTNIHVQEDMFLQMGILKFAPQFLHQFETGFKEAT